MSRLLNLFTRRRDRLEADLTRELRDHLERATRDLVAEGVPPEEARRRAHLQLGGVAQVQEDVRETWTWRWLDSLRLDVRHTVRSFRRRPLFALGTGAILSIAIAANVALFAVVNTTLLRPLDYPAADRLVTLETRWNSSGRVSADVSGPDFLDWQSQNDVFDAMAVWYGEDDVATVVGDRAVFANDRYVSAGFFAVFGQQPGAGRLLHPDDVPREGAAPTVAVVAHDWAARHFGSASAAVDQVITVYGLRLTIVGVAAAGFRYPGVSDIWVPWETTDGGTNRSVLNYQAIARLRPGVDVREAGIHMSAIAARLSSQHPENDDRGIVVTPLQTRVTGHLQSTLWMLLGAAGLVLLIACANVANLQLANAGRRTRELSLRAALGAGRRRVAQQLMVEHGLLLGVSTVSGVALALLASRVFDVLAPASLGGATVFRDPLVLAFILGIFTLALLMFAATTARSVWRADLVSTLGAAGGRSITAGGHPRVRAALVVVEVALSVVLLVAAGLLLRSFVSLQQVNLGFTTDRVLVAYTQYVAENAEQRRQRSAFYADAISTLRRQPGVLAAAGVSLLPMGREPRPAREFFVQGRPDAGQGHRPTTEVYGITPAYFDTLGIPLHQGRMFTDADTLDQPPVAVINDTLARTVFADQPALGAHVRWGERGPWLRIVGIVGDTRWQSPGAPPPAMIYVPSAQGFGGSLSLLVRTDGDQAQMMGAMASILRASKPDMPVRVHAMTELFSEALAHPRLRVQVTGVFAAAAAVLAALGLFSVLGYLVSLRTREIAVRRAVGAGTADIVRLVVGQGVRLVTLGLAIGLLAAAATARSLQALLFGIGPWDPAVYAGVIGVLALAAAFAIVLPALRAAAVAPVVALSQE